jgi:hypothetical protein
MTLFHCSNRRCFRLSLMGRSGRGENARLPAILTGGRKGGNHP